MANICDTLYVVYGNQAMLIKLYLDLQIATETDDGLYRVYQQAGYKFNEKTGEFEKPDNTWIRCRGVIEGFEARMNNDEENDDGTIRYINIYCTTAWSPFVESFERLLKEKYSGLEMVCQAEEPGCDVFINTDTSHKYLPTKWQIDSDEGTKYFNYNEGEYLLKEIERISGYKFANLGHALSNEDKIIEAIAKKKGVDIDDVYFVIHEFTPY